MHLKFKDEKKQRKSTNSKRKAYLFTLASFMVSIFILCISPAFTGATYKYDELKIGAYQPLTNGVQIAIAKKVYNPKKQMLRIDYSLQAENGSQVLSNLKYKVENKYIKQKQDDVKTTVYRASDNYIVVISKNIPEEFGVVSSTVTPEYIHPELEYDPNDLKEQSLKSYILEKAKLKDTSLKEESKADYELEYIALSQKNLVKEIKDLDTKIKDKKEANKQLKIKNEALSKDMDYQTEDEKAQTLNDINENTSTISNNEIEIEDLKNEKKTKQDKIKLLDEKKATVTKG